MLIVWPLTVAAALLIAACSSAAPPAQPTRALAGELDVLAAASLQPVLDRATPQLESDNPGLHVTYSYAGSQQLVQELLDGASADVIATADTTTMHRLVAAALVDAPSTFAHNLLEIAVASGNPKHIASLTDLANPGINLVLADPSVPAGNYAERALARAGVVVIPRSLELSVTSALEKVESGDADAAIVYTTDIASAEGKVAGVAIAAADNVTATYAVATLNTSRDVPAARAYVDDVLHGVIHTQLLRSGFLPP